MSGPQQHQQSGDEPYTHTPKTDESDIPIKSEDESSHAAAQQAHVYPDAGLSSTQGRPQVPLPSELLNSYRPPAELFEEKAPVADPSSFAGLPTTYPGLPAATDARGPDFAARANDLINQMLGRTPGGTSVVDPDSVLSESGRLYHGYKDGKYLIPNDAAEQDRLDLQHEMYRLLFDGWLALAPMSRPPRYVLDIGTGTGLWAKEFAEQNPSSYVIGSDLSAIQPETTLPNLAFTRDDAEDPWVFPLPRSHLTDEQVGNWGSEAHFISFDYIHVRLAFSCFNDPRVVIRQAFESLSPGGWMEFQDLAPEILQANPEFQGDALSRWSDACGRGAQAFGRDIYVVRKYKGWMEDAGFVDVNESRFILPSHQWMDDPKLKEVGRFNQRNLMEGARGAGWKALKSSGMTSEEIDLLISQVHTELMTRRNHTYGYVYVVYGRKPAPEEAGAGVASAPVNG